MRLSRRKLAGIAGAAFAVPALAQTPGSVPTPSDPDQAARESNKRSSETLAKFEIPLATEPAFQFKA